MGNSENYAKIWKFSNNIKAQKIPIGEAYYIKPLITEEFYFINTYNPSQ